MAKPINIINTNTGGSQAAAPNVPQGGSQAAAPNVPQGGGQGGGNSSGINKSLQNMFSKKFADWPVPVLFLIAFIVAMTARYAAGLFLAGSNLSFVWQEILKIIFAFMILGALGSLSKTKVIGVAVGLLVLLLSFSQIAKHDFSSERSERRQAKLERQAETEALIRLDAEKADFLLLEPNKTHVFELTTGEETKWRGFPENRAGSYGISSESHDYTIFFSDGTSYKGDPNGSLPLKGRVFFKIKAHSPQTVYITVM